MKRYIFLPFLFLQLFNGYSQDLTFAVLTDLHIVPGNKNDSVFPSVINEIEAKNPDFILITGDLTNQGNDMCTNF